MEPISTALAGIALVQQSVEFIKKNIETVQDIGHKKTEKVSIGRLKIYEIN